MPRYYFHIHNSSGLTRDEEGLELPGPEEAYEQALMGIRSLLGEELAGGKINLQGFLEIADDRGSVTREVPFGDAVEVLPAGSKSA